MDLRGLRARRRIASDDKQRMQQPRSQSNVRAQLARGSWPLRLGRFCARQGAQTCKNATTCLGTPNKGAIVLRWQPVARLVLAHAPMQAQEPNGVAPARATTDGPLDAVNDGFHASYDEARASARHDGPVFVVLADALVVFHHAQRKAFSFAPRAFHVIKSAAHAPIMLYAMYEREQAPTRDQLLEARRRLASATAMAESAALDPELSETALEDVRCVLQACGEAVDRLLAESPPQEVLDALASRMGVYLLRMAQEATALQLRALHAHTERALELLSPAERVALHVVVAGDHQARVRSLAMQYYKRRLPEPQGAETRVSYAEGVSDERAAFALVGTQRLDRQIARAFFGEERRLQRDILGDAAAEQLASFELHEIR